MSTESEQPEAGKKTGNKERTDRYFTGIIVILAIFLIVIGCQLYSQHTREKETTAAILQAQTEYFTLQHQKFDLLAKNDTLKKHPDLYAAYAKALRAEVSRDSVAWKSGTEAAMRDVKSLVEIHLQSIERQYDTLTLWAAVLTIVFLIFNFYSIFKLESTLAEAKSQFAKLDSEVLNQMNRINEESQKQREKSQLFSDGLRAQEQKEYDKVIEYYQQYLKLDPNNAIVHYNLGNAYYQKEEYNKAIESYLKAIKINPKDADAYNNLGVVYKDIKEYEKAIEAFLKAIEIESNNASAHHNLGVVYRDIKDWENAEKYFNQALTLRPGHEKTIKAIEKLEELRAADKPGKD